MTTWLLCRAMRQCSLHLRLDLGTLCISKHENRWGRKGKENVYGCLNCTLALSSAQFRATMQLVTQSTTWPFFFASAEKKLEMAALHTNMRIRSLPFAHLFYAAPCSITIFIIIKQGLFFLWQVELMNLLPTRLHPPSLFCLFSSISAHPSSLPTLPPKTSLKLPTHWPG